MLPRYMVLARIRSIRFLPMSVFESSVAPAMISPMPSSPGLPSIGKPEFTPNAKVFSPRASKPAGLAKLPNEAVPRAAWRRW